MNLKNSLLLFSLVYYTLAFADCSVYFNDFTKGISKERANFDVLRYDLNVKIDIEHQSISGSNVMSFRVKDARRYIQIDLQQPMILDSMVFEGEKLTFSKGNNAEHYFKLSRNVKANEVVKVLFYFHGKPTVAKNAPWDGGWVWSRSQGEEHFIATACQSLGASSWWPCKDHPSDEPNEGMTIQLGIPAHHRNLSAVSNGKLTSTFTDGDWNYFNWEVKNPINNYGVNVNIGNYGCVESMLETANGKLSCSLYFLQENLLKAKESLQVKEMITAFEHWFGPYPFYEDGYKLVEVPYLGMEHQSSVTYGNGFQNGYKGKDLSATGWGMKFDFILVHESAHEWFANSITNANVADMWIHESFTSYAEGLYLDCYYGKEAAAAYVIGTRKLIQQQHPIYGNPSLNQVSEGTDMYYKGANVLHTLRQMINDDEKWRAILKGLNQEFFHQIVDYDQITDYIQQQSGLKLKGFFEQYIKTTKIPVLEYQIVNGKLLYQWKNVLKNFNMDVQLKVNGKMTRLPSTQQLKQIKLEEEVKTVEPNENYYIIYTGIKKL